MSLKRPSEINIKRAKRKFVTQPNTADCGVACLSSAIRYYGGEAEFESLRELSGTSSTGTTLLGLQTAANMVGIDAVGYRLNDINDLKDADQLIIIPVTIDNKLNHYYILFTYNKGQFVIGDPGNGVRKISPEELEKEWPTKAVLALEPTDKIELKKEKQKNKIQFVYSLVKEDLPYFGASVFLGILIALIGISVATFLQRFIDQVIPLKDETKFISGILTLAMIFFLRIGLTYARGILINRQTREFNIRMISGFLRKILHLPKRFFNNRKTGDFITRLNDTFRVQGYVNQLLGGLSIDIIVFVVSLIAISTYDMQLMLLIVACVVTYAIISFVYLKPLRTHQKKTMQAYSANESNYINTIQGNADILQFSKEDIFYHRAVKHFTFFQDNAYKAAMLTLNFRSQTGIVGILFTLTIMGFGSWLIFKEAINIGEFLAIMTLANYILPAIERIIHSITQFQEANIALDRILQITSRSNDPGLIDKRDESIQEFKELSVEKVSFRFPGEKELFIDLSLRIKKGEWISIEGDNGIGKSTLFGIILGHHQIEKGAVKLNGVPIQNEYKNSFVQEKVALVPQEVHLFDHHLLFNIVLTEDSKQIEHSMKILSSYGLDLLFQRFPQGYLTILGEGGVQISAGQRQLIALARALVTNPSVLLLDEPFNFVDKETKRFISQLLEGLRGEVTILMITHNLEVADLADIKLELKDGSLHKYEAHLEF
jgi:ABC-type bacteriocin/lantibiotic exporter with double-glycine peptidase domain